MKYHLITCQCSNIFLNIFCPHKLGLNFNSDEIELLFASKAYE